MEAGGDSPDGLEPGAPGAGWYPDPEHPQAAMRYWDGSRWTESRAPYTEHARASGGNDVLVAAGYIGSLIPIIGLIIGAVLLGRRDRHGPWVFGLSLLFFGLFVLIGILND